MAARRPILIVVLLLATAWAAAQQTTPNPTSPNGQRTSSTHPNPEPPSDRCNCTMNAEQVRALQADLQRMRTLIQQMQMNLVSLPPGPTPLRHQFELEIDMWQLLLGHMERTLAGTTPSPRTQH